MLAWDHQHILILDPLSAGHSHLLVSVQVTLWIWNPAIRSGVLHQAFASQVWLMHRHSWQDSQPPELRFCNSFIYRFHVYRLSCLQTPVYRLWSIKSRQVQFCTFLTLGCSDGAVLNTIWLLWLCFSSAEQNAALTFWCWKGLHRPHVQGSLQIPYR